MITVKYFAQLRQMAGKDEDQFDLGAQVTLDQLSDAIGTSLPKIGELVRDKKIMVSANHDVVASDHIFKDGDEVALLPPFSGGI
ncbi:MAG: MoaD/ThiS family protein [Candidatus Nitronauta litoralis]|uniref:Molybdopterin synthase sulfur carrier subunit n=1 Tax=Candidatus Nitronauta litoralis TaxID=2705533 RepID=A0A7T0BYZ4_9BACT|nr:MAG: MoaD/ThiS family protein [Candidatus Nitronauta litoralis]